MSVVTKRRKITVLEYLNGGILSEDIQRVIPQNYFPIRITAPQHATSMIRERKGKMGDDSDEFLSKVTDTKPIPNMRRCFYEDGKFKFSI
jgi:hypothetical protein